MIDSARCTAAAPWYFKPQLVDNVGTFQDGGLQHNMSMQIAIWEARRLWAGEYPDIGLSLGTGHLWTDQSGSGKILHDASSTRRCHSSTCLTFPTVEPSKSVPTPTRTGLTRRLLTAFVSRLDGGNEWARFRNTAPASVVSRCIRLDPSLRSPPQLDDTSALQDLERQTERFLREKDGELRLICDRLVASSFYFELDNLPRRLEGRYHCGGYIQCRLPLKDNGRIHLFERLLKQKAFFAVNGEAFSCMVSDNWAASTPYRCRIAFIVNSLDEEVRIVLSGGVQQAMLISGMPSSASRLVERQMLDAPFGRVDHIVPPADEHSIGEGSHRIDPDAASGLRTLEWFSRD